MTTLCATADGHYEKVAVMASARPVDAAVSSEDELVGLDLLHIILPARGLVACTASAA